MLSRKTPTREQSAEEQEPTLPPTESQVIDKQSSLSPIDQLTHVVEALCEEPFESEAMDEDVANFRARIAQLVRQHADAAWEKVKRTQRDGERLERMYQEEHQETFPDVPPPSDKM